MTAIVITYLLYIVLSVLLTLWVGHTLHKNGAVFLDQIFRGDQEISISVNKLLLIGFYLINFGYVLRNLVIRRNTETIQQSIEMLSMKLGHIIVILGVMHFFNLFALFFWRKMTRNEEVNA